MSAQSRRLAGGRDVCRCASGLAAPHRARRATTTPRPLRCRYTLHPSGIKEFLRLTNEKLELRQQLLPFLGCVVAGGLRGKSMGV